MSVASPAPLTLTLALPPVTAGPPPIMTYQTGGAHFVGTDIATQGGWVGTYGADGYEVISGSTQLPSYAVVSPSGQSTWTWNPATTDPRAPWSSPAASSR